MRCFPDKKKKSSTKKLNAIYLSSRSIKCAVDAYNVRVLLLRISIITISTKTILTLSIARRNFRADTCVKKQVLKREKKIPSKSIPSRFFKF